ncbi:type II secretion system protein GspM [Thioflavicoccus mobilis]|uniref:type II secretion system protein GspM n=1 Tax=Thioflavicoccus mobilis TaxID=80679 RepID=UPI00059F7E44|nr:type II secretion system protein GspM [Thioflavicoccus mobilis]
MSRAQARVALLFLLLALVAVIALVWWRQIEGRRLMLRGVHEELAQLSAIVRERPRLERDLASLNEQLRKSGYFLVEKSPKKAAKVLEDRVEWALRATEARLLSFRASADNDTEPVTRIRVMVSAQGDEQDLLQLLYRCERGKPIISVTRLRVRTMLGSRSPYSDSDAPPLDIQFELIGYLLQN